MALSQSALSELLDAFRTGDGVDMIRESPTAGGHRDPQGLARAHLNRSPGIASAALALLAAVTGVGG